MHKKMSKHLKTLICLLAVVVLVLSNSSSVMADTSATNNQTDYRLVLEDDADFFTSDEESDLVDLMEDITIYGNVIVATSTSHSYYSSEDYAVAIYENKFGEGSDGVVFVIDRDLNNIRNTEEFKVLMKEYEEKHLQEIAADADGDDSAYELKVEEIPFTKEGGVCKVKCAINGLPLHFIFDTGAADVSISSVEATFMAKNDFLSSSDIIGKQNYQTADGNITEGTIINLKDVKLGSLHLNNIKASVVRKQAAPLLLGQSVLSKLGKIEIDNTKKVLRITHKQKIN